MQYILGVNRIKQMSNLLTFLKSGGLSFSSTMMTVTDWVWTRVWPDAGSLFSRDTRNFIVSSFWNIIILINYKYKKLWVAHKTLRVDYSSIFPLAIRLLIVIFNIVELTSLSKGCIRVTFPVSEFTANLSVPTKPYFIWKKNH